MLIRLQNYLRANPLPLWLYLVSFFAAVYATKYHFFAITNNPTTKFLYIGHVLVPPTMLLLFHSVDEERRRHPFPPSQERTIGWIAAMAACVSVLSGGGFLVLRVIEVRNAFTALTTFVFSSMLALAMGYITRRTKMGYWGAKLAALWLLFTALAAILMAAIGTFR